MRMMPKSAAWALKRDLVNSPYFQGLPEKVLEEMVPFFHQRFFAKGAIILKENSRARLLFILCKGTVALSIRRGEGELVMEIVKKKGALFGWSAIVSPRRYTASAKALGDCRVLSIQRKDMERLFQRYPSFGRFFLQRLASLIATRLHSTRSLLAEALS